MKALALLLVAASASAAPIDFDRGISIDLQRLLSDVPPPVAVPARPVRRRLVYERDGSLISTQQLIRRLAQARVVYSGEQHDQAAHHQVQLELIKALHGIKPDLVVGMEMVSKDLQPDLDRWLSGGMPDADFVQFWKKAWGYPYELYKPILEYCKAQRIPIKGLNAPIGVVRQIAKGGLSSLTPVQRAWLPANIAQTSNAKYLAYLEKSLDGHGPMPPQQKANMLVAMAAWNETMGDSVAAADAPMVVVAGSGHMVYGMGVPESAARRGSNARQVVLPYPLDGEAKPLAELLKDLRDPNSDDRELADHFWLLPKD